MFLVHYAATINTLESKWVISWGHDLMNIFFDKINNILNIVH